jgi:transcriptional regulator with XRE-family HTH domain
MPQSLTANQLVAYNLMRIRKTLGLSQEQAAKRLEPYLAGKRWSKAVYSAAERSYHGNRIRQFNADDLVAMALAFGVPIAYFFLPPRPEDRKEDAAVRSGDTEVSWRDLFTVMLGGTYRATMRYRALELPHHERPPLNSATDRVLLQLSADPPDGPLGRMEAVEPEDES